MYYRTVPYNWCSALVGGQPVSGLSAAARSVDVGAALDSVSRAEQDAFRMQEAETLRWYPERDEKREVIRDDAKADHGECEFKFGESLRITWVSQQHADKELAVILKSKPITDGYRVASDGVLEREVKLPPPCPSKWVRVVPDGLSLAHMTWKRWIFLQCHIGFLGGHRSAEKTYLLMVRQCWWKTMKADIDKWVNDCLTCMRCL